MKRCFLGYVISLCIYVTLCIIYIFNISRVDYTDILTYYLISSVIYFFWFWGIYLIKKLGRIPFLIFFIFSIIVSAYFIIDTSLDVRKDFSLILLIGVFSSLLTSALIWVFKGKKKEK